MILHPGLNKKNFFNEMEEKYPQPMLMFLAWIDEYKRLVNWNELFGERIKFHNLPFDMQSGIWYRFIIEQGEVIDIDLRLGIKRWLSDKNKDFINI